MDAPQTKHAVARILRAFHEYTKPMRGYFIRFKDGDTLNCCAANLAYVHPHDTFAHPDWKVDWDCALQEHSHTRSEDIAFVRMNMGSFAKLYEHQKRHAP